MWPLLLLVSLLLLGRGGSRQTDGSSPRPRSSRSSLPDHRRGVRQLVLRGPLLPGPVPAGAAPGARGSITGWIRQPRARLLAAGVVMLTLLIGLADQQTEQGQPAPVRLPRRARGHQGGRGAEQPGPLRAAGHALRARVLRARASSAAALQARDQPRREGSPVFVLASFQDNKAFFNQTNKVVGQLTFFRKLRAPVQDAANAGLGVPMSSRPWDVRLRRVTWDPVPSGWSVRTASRFLILLGLPCRRLVLRLAAAARTASARPYLYGLLIAAELFNPMQAFGFWWTVLERARAREARHRPNAWPSTSSSPSTTSRRTSST